MFGNMAKPEAKSSESEKGESPLSVEDNHISFCDDVTTKSIQKLNESIRTLGKKLRVEQVQFDLLTPRPIHLHIHSYGGLLSAGVAGLETISKSTVAVHTHIEGCAASAATLLSMAGARRTMGRYSSILIHHLSSGTWGTYEQIKDHMEQSTHLMNQMIGFYQNRSRMKEEEIREILKRDLWFDAEKALRLGLIDEIV